ncbi:hypothetical protein [Flavobacterium lindanitolerans]|uniref:hypothetical protein n=1 Tax=Flavobacterium lindanitolerans TaxID=428988 RepID=UPI0028077A65|nr:hypothetical protein [Flavobacterium lindanitolerans]MDQ7960266.1 hypothetical protein [Flavobacterium lindanitolerans]
MSTEIKNTLFRFVTMRSPELSEETNKDKRFIYRTPGADGIFDTAVKNRDNGQTKWEVLRWAATNFVPMEESDFNGFVVGMKELGVWIAKNKHSYTIAELTQKVTAIQQALSLSDVFLLWENLFYQVATHKDFYLKESIMQLLKANHVFENFDANNTKLIKQLMNAKVVLPKELFVEDAAVLPTTPAGQTITLPGKEMKRVQTISKTNESIERHRKLKKEMEKVEKIYKRDYKIAYDNALKQYREDIKPILAAYEAALETEKQNWCSIRNPELPYNPNDPCDNPVKVPEPELPEFKFSFRDELDLGYLEGVLSAPSYETLLEVLDIDTKIASRSGAIENFSLDPVLPSFGGLNLLIDDGINNNTQVIIGNTPGQGNTSISIGGVVIPSTGTLDLLAEPFAYQICPKDYKSSSVGGTYINFDLTFSIPDSSWQIIGVRTTVENLSGVKTYGTAFTQSWTGNKVTLPNLHNDALTEDDFYSTMKTLTVEISFSNGAKKSLTVNFFQSFNCISGRKMVTITEPNQETPEIPTIPSVPETGIEGTFIPSGFGVRQLGIADYKKVEQSIQGYVEGEVAAIENVMAREYKEKATRRLRRSENTTTTSSENEREQLTDTTSTTRHEMQNEIARIIQDDKNFAAGTFFNADLGKYNIGGNVNMATHSSKEESTRQAVTEAKEITERAMERIVAKVKEERIEKIIDEFEENNKHGFDNTKGDNHVVGVYRWVDKVFKNQVLNYGKRLMFEFMIPEPAKLHFLGMAENPAITKLVEPVDPRTYVDPANAAIKFNLENYALVNENTVRYWAGKYNVEIPDKPEEVIHCGASFGVTFDGVTSSRHEGAAGSGKIEIPEGYITTRGTLNFTATKDNDRQVYSGMHASLGKVNKLLPGQDGSIDLNETFDLVGYVQSVPVSYTMSNFLHGNLNASVECKLTNEVKDRWQKETFKAIIDAYEEAVAEYEQKLAEEKAKEVIIKETNSGFYRQIENLILRKNCISYIIDQNSTAKRTYGKDMSKPLGAGVVKNFGNHEIQVDAKLDDYTAFVKFIEQAFEWDIMSYNFYPYYWGARQSWEKLYQNENNDPLFRSFIQAGMARVIVTVRPGFEEAVSYYMQTGQIWNGGEVPVIEDKLFLSIVDELNQTEGQKEGKAWATRIPTSLTILQADSIGLKVDKALPFDEDLSDFEDPTSVPQSENFYVSDSLLSGEDENLAEQVEEIASKMIGKIAIEDGYLKLKTNSEPSQTISQITIETLKESMNF